MERGNVHQDTTPPAPILQREYTMGLNIMGKQKGVLCGECGNGFSTEEKLREHKKAEHSPKTYKYSEWIDKSLNERKKIVLQYLIGHQGETTTEIAQALFGKNVVSSHEKEYGNVSLCLRELEEESIVGKSGNKPYKYEPVLRVRKNGIPETFEEKEKCKHCGKTDFASPQGRASHERHCDGKTEQEEHEQEEQTVDESEELVIEAARPQKTAIPCSGCGCEWETTDTKVSAQLVTCPMCSGEA